MACKRAGQLTAIGSHALGSHHGTGLAQHFRVQLQETLGAHGFTGGKGMGKLGIEYPAEDGALHTVRDTALASAATILVQVDGGPVAFIARRNKRSRTTAGQWRRQCSLPSKPYRLLQRSSLRGIGVNASCST